MEKIRKDRAIPTRDSFARFQKRRWRNRFFFAVGLVVVIGCLTFFISRLKPALPRGPELSLDRYRSAWTVGS
jgi:hypothetical protein